jgi:hypothetical protein
MATLIKSAGSLIVWFVFLLFLPKFDSQRQKVQKYEAETTDWSINQIRGRIKGQVSRAVVGQIVKRVRDRHQPDSR